MPIIAHGVDIVSIERIERALAAQPERFRSRVFTAQECDYADDGGERRRGERFAARFACKEAVFKALGTGWSEGVAWTDVGVVRMPTGRPLVELTGRAAVIAAEQGIRSWHLSLSHTAGLALASVVASGDPAAS